MITQEVAQYARSGRKLMPGFAKGLAAKDTVKVAIEWPGGATRMEARPAWISTNGLWAVTETPEKYRRQGTWTDKWTVSLVKSGLTLATCTSRKAVLAVIGWADALSWLRTIADTEKFTDADEAMTWVPEDERREKSRELKALLSALGQE